MAATFALQPNATATFAPKPLQVDMRFGSTELEVVARDLQTGNAVATSLEWDGELEG